MPGPWSETRTGTAAELTTEWYETGLDEQTEYEVEVALAENFAGAVTHRFTTQPTDRDVTLRSLSITPEGQPPIPFTEFDWTRETDGPGSDTYFYRLHITLDRARRATVNAAAVSNAATVTVDPMTIVLASGTFPTFDVLIENNGRQRTYSFSVAVTAPDQLEFDDISAPSTMWDMASDGASTMWVGDRDRGVHVYDFNTKQHLGFLVRNDLEGLAYDADNRTLWLSNATNTVREYTTDTLVRTGRSVRIGGRSQFLAWYDGNLYCKNVANDARWWVVDTETARAAGSVDLTGIRISAAHMWRDADHYFTVAGINRASAFTAYNVSDNTQDTELTERYTALQDLIDQNGSSVRGLWGNATHFFLTMTLTEGGVRKSVITAFNRLTGNRDVTIGANFQGDFDFDLREGGVANAVDLWGNASTMWVLNNRIQDVTFTGNETKLVAFNRATRRPDRSKDIAISSLIPQGQCITGNATHLWVLGFGVLRCWTHAGARTPSLDISNVPANTVAVQYSDPGFFVWLSGQRFRATISNLEAREFPVTPNSRVSGDAWFFIDYDGMVDPGDTMWLHSNDRLTEWRFKIRRQVEIDPTRS